MYYILDLYNSFSMYYILDLYNSSYVLHFRLV
jgi:hypothetical protein